MFHFLVTSNPLKSSQCQCCLNIAARGIISCTYYQEFFKEVHVQTDHLHLHKFKTIILNSNSSFFLSWLLCLLSMNGQNIYHGLHCPVYFQGTVGSDRRCLVTRNFQIFFFFWPIFRRLQGSALHFLFLTTVICSHFKM